MLNLEEVGITQRTRKRSMFQQREENMKNKCIEKQQQRFGKCKYNYNLECVKQRSKREGRKARQRPDDSWLCAILVKILTRNDGWRLENLRRACFVDDFFVLS